MYNVSDVRVFEILAEVLSRGVDNVLQLGLNDIPEQVEPAMLEDEDFLQKFHHALLEVIMRYFCWSSICGNHEDCYNINGAIPLELDGVFDA